MRRREPGPPKGGRGGGDGKPRVGPQQRRESHGGSVDRPFFDKLMKDEKAKLQSEADAKRFIQCLVQYDDPLELLFRLTDPQVCGS